MRTKILLSFSLVFLFSSSSVFASNSPEIIINEIAWMGGASSASDEWIELYNNANTEINLDGWGLYEEGGKTLVEPLIGIIGAKSYYLIERTDDNTVSGIEASQPPTGWGGYGLNNNGERLQLLDNSSNIIDEVDCSGGWFAGIGKPEYKTMERINPLIIGNEANNWQTSKNPGGTPKAENQCPEVDPRDIEENIAEVTPVEQSYEVEPRVVYPSNIFINEILPSPEGSDIENEWIEVFNKNNFEVDVSGWKIRDIIGATKTYTFPEKTKIKAEGFLVIYRPETKITLNNSGDGLELSNPSGEIIDKINYEKASLGQSFNRTLQGFVWSTTLTPEKENIITEEEVLNQKIEEDILVVEKSETDRESFLPEKTLGAAKIEENLPKSLNSFSLFLIASIIAVFSVIIVMILKKKIETKEY